MTMIATLVKIMIIAITAFSFRFRVHHPFNLALTDRPCVQSLFLSLNVFSFVLRFWETAINHYLVTNKCLTFTFTEIQVSPSIVILPLFLLEGERRGGQPLFISIAPSFVIRIRLPTSVVA